MLLVISIELFPRFSIFYLLYLGVNTQWRQMIFIGKVGYLDTLEKGSVVVYGPFRQAAEG